MLRAGRMPQLSLVSRRGKAVHVDDRGAGDGAAIYRVGQFSAVFELYVFIFENCACDHGDGGP